MSRLLTRTFVTNNSLWEGSLPLGGEVCSSRETLLPGGKMFYQGRYIHPNGES
jgi:hypothetical protein